MATDNSVEAVERALGQPVTGELSDNALKVRRNLLALSFVSVFVVLGGIRLDPGSTILGFKFVGLTDELLRIGLAAVTLYLLAHFLWYAYEALLEWRVRVTGTRLAFLTGSKFANDHADYPDDPRQSTLYSWWSGQARRIGDIGTRAALVDETMKGWEEKLRAVLENKADGSNLHVALNSLTEARNALTELKRSVDRAQEAMSAQRIPVSLARFDAWFQLFLRSQNLRWLLIDILLPIIVGAWAVLLLACHL